MNSRHRLIPVKLGIAGAMLLSDRYPRHCHGSKQAETNKDQGKEPRGSSEAKVVSASERSVGTFQIEREMIVRRYDEGRG